MNRLIGCLGSNAFAVARILFLLRSVSGWVRLWLLALALVVCVCGCLWTQLNDVLHGCCVLWYDAPRPAGLRDEEIIETRLGGVVILITPHVCYLPPYILHAEP